MSDNNHRVLIILGSPKSGISLLTDCFRLLETDSADNQSLIIKDSILIHRLFCQDIGINFITSGSLPNKWRDSAAAEKAKKRIYNLLTNHQNKSDTWIMADPFICLTLPLWQKVFGELNLTPLFVHIIRHPWETAKSLANSNNIDLHKGHLIWLSYNYKALSIRLNYPYAMVFFDQLLADPVSALSYIAKALGIEYSNELRIKYSALLNFVQPNVRFFHAGGATEVDKAAFAPFFSFYDQLRVLQEFRVQPSVGKSPDETFLPADFATNKQIIPTWNMLEFILKEIGKYEQKEYGKDKLIARQDTIQANPIFYMSVFLPHGNDIYKEKKIILSEKGWEKISIRISNPNLLSNNKLKIVPLNTNGTVFISSIRIINRATNAVLWAAQNAKGFDQLILEGSVFRLPDQENMALLITGDDPRLILPCVKKIPDCPMDIVVWLKASRDQTIVHKYLTTQCSVFSGKLNNNNQVSTIANNTLPHKSHALDYSAVTDQFLLSASKKLLYGNSEDRFDTLSDISRLIQDISGESEPCEISLNKFSTEEKTFNIIYINGDHIPCNIVKDNKFYEYDYLKILSSFYKPGDLIIDGGANIGNHTLYFAGIMGGKVIAIEPEPHNAVLLAVNVAMNGILENVHFLRHGLGRESRSVRLKMAVNDNYGSFSAMPEAKPTRNDISNCTNVQVPIESLDKSLDDLVISSPISIIKLDVEGMECEVLEGSAKTIGSSLPVIGVECFRQSDLQKVENILKYYNYFPFEMTNWTPTFVFLSRDNPFHMSRLSDYLCNKTLEGAMKKNNFVKKPS